MYYYYLINRIKEDHPIMSLSLSKDARYALLNVASQVSVYMYIHTYSNYYCIHNDVYIWPVAFAAFFKKLAHFLKCL